MTRQKVYLAGPDVFLPDAIEIGRHKQALCTKYGFEGLFPLDQDDDTPADASAIFSANCGLMDHAKVGLFNLTPFRGPSADAGTVFELGMMFAQDKPVYGYSSDLSDYCNRVYTDGYQIEDFGLVDNLMIDRAIHNRGGSIIRVQEHTGDPLAAITAFEDCLARMAIELNRPQK